MSSTRLPLRLDNLCKSFGRIRAVDDLSLEIHPGEMVGFLGPNGAGKSTTLYMICRLVRPSAGSIEIFGHNVRHNFKDAIHHVGAMVETPPFYEYLSARRNLKLIGRLRGNTSDSQIDEILARIGLSDRRSDRVGTYSQGMKQRLGLGMALLGRPRLLILDEPTSGMDPEGTQEILTFLRQKVKEDGLTVFISSHLLYEVEEYCDRVLVINHGSLIASGAVKQILTPHDNVIRVTFQQSAPDHRTLENEQAIAQVEILSNNTLEITLKDQDSAWLNALLISRGYKVLAIDAKQKTLKEFFLAITGENNNA